MLGSVAPWFLRPLTAIITITGAFTFAVALDWIPTDETGLASVGVAMLGCGVAIGGFVVITAAELLWNRKPRR